MAGVDQSRESDVVHLRVVPPIDRDAAHGFRLDIPAGTAVRFEPGDEKTVNLLAFSGDRAVYGFRNRINGPLEPSRGLISLQDDTK